VVEFIEREISVMPSLYSLKQYEEDSYYHVFNRGMSKGNIFLDDSDYRYFLGLIGRYLSGAKVTDAHRNQSPDYSENITMLAYCLMPNHFHLLLHQQDANALTSFMRSLGTAYSMYFNKKYKRSGALFQGRYKAIMANEDSYFTHLSRYIHLNPLDIGEDYRSYRYSSYQAWAGGSVGHDWLDPSRGMAEFRNEQEYEKFVADYLSVRAKLDEIKRLLRESD